MEPRLDAPQSRSRATQRVGHAWDTSDVIEERRPVLYRYRADRVEETEARVVHYGLVAEEAAEVAPHLVTC